MPTAITDPTAFYQLDGRGCSPANRMCYHQFSAPLDLIHHCAGRHMPLPHTALPVPPRHSSRFGRRSFANHTVAVNARLRILVPPLRTGQRNYRTTTINTYRSAFKCRRARTPTTLIAGRCLRTNALPFALYSPVPTPFLRPWFAHLAAVLHLLTTLLPLRYGRGANYGFSCWRVLEHRLYSGSPQFPVPRGLICKLPTYTCHLPPPHPRLPPTAHDAPLSHPSLIPYGGQHTRHRFLTARLFFLPAIRCWRRAFGCRSPPHHLACSATVGSPVQHTFSPALNAHCRVTYLPYGRGDAAHAAL